MAQSHMKEVAKLLGVELGEAFQIKFKNTEDPWKNVICFLDEHAGLCQGDTMHACNDYLASLLTGDFEIVKLPWRPVVGEECYYVDCDGGIVKTCFSFTSVFIMLLYKHKKLYRTEQEAIKYSKEDEAYWQQIKEGIIAEYITIGEIINVKGQI